MERVSSKTHDAYIEVETLQDAINIVERFQNNINKGRVPRLGDRPVDIELSSQSELMAQLFPVAVGIIWHGSIPEILPSNPREPWSNFKRFVSTEEMIMLVKHVEVPQRVSVFIFSFSTSANGSLSPSDVVLDAFCTWYCFYC